MCLHRGAKPPRGREPPIVLVSGLDRGEPGKIHGREARRQTGDRPGSKPSGGTDTTEIRLPGAPERQRILDLGASVWAFSALASAFEGGILDELATPANSSADQRTDRNVGCPDRGRPRCAHCARPRSCHRRRIRLHAWHVVYTGGRRKEIVCADLRATHLLAAELSERFRTGDAAARGWRYSDPALLDAWDASVEPVTIWAERLFPALEGLPEALHAPTAHFLDVGTGVVR